MKTRHDLVADLLMGAALADGHLDGREAEAVRAILCEALRMKRLPARMEKALGEFDPSAFDAKATAAQLGLTTAKERRNLLELIARVHDADDTLDLAEDAYLREVGDALGLDEEAYADLAVGELTIEELGDKLMPGPPPLPKG